MTLKHEKCKGCGAPVVTLKTVREEITVDVDVSTVYHGGTHRMTGSKVYKPDEFFIEKRHKLHVCPEDRPKRKHRARKTFAATLPQLDLEYPEVPEKSEQKDPQ